MARNVGSVLSGSPFGPGNSSGLPLERRVRRTEPTSNGAVVFGEDTRKEIPLALEWVSLLRKNIQKKIFGQHKMSVPRVALSNSGQPSL